MVGFEPSSVFLVGLRTFFSFCWSWAPFNWRSWTPGSALIMCSSGSAFLIFFFRALLISQSRFNRGSASFTNFFCTSARPTERVRACRGSLAGQERERESQRIQSFHCLIRMHQSFQVSSSSGRALAGGLHVASPG